MKRKEVFSTIIPRYPLMNIFILAIFVGILTAQQVQDHKPTIMFDDTYLQTDTIEGQVQIRTRSLMNIFLERFGSGEFFDYLSLDGDHGPPHEEYQRGLINRSGLEEHWTKIKHEKALGLYICTSDDTLEFLFRDVGSLDDQAMMAVDNFLRFGEPYSPRVDEKIKILMNHKGEDVMDFLEDVESRIQSGKLVQEAERATYQTILRYEFYREVGARPSTKFSVETTKPCYLLCVFHNHNDGQPPSPADYEASKNVLMGTAIFHEDNTITYEFLSNGKRVGAFGPLASQMVQRKNPSRLKYHKQGQVKMIDRGYNYDSSRDRFRWSLEIDARPEVIAMLIFDRENRYLGIIHREPFKAKGSVIRLDEFPTIPNGSLGVDLPVNVDHILVVLANGTAKRYIPLFVTQ